MQIQILGKQLQITDARIEYCNIHKKYADLAHEMGDNFIAWSESLNGYKSFWEKCHTGDRMIEKAIQIGLDDLIERGNYRLTINVFMEQYIANNLNWPNVLLDWQEQFQDVINDNEALNEHRTQRRQSRTRLIGGGFGIEGAAKGMATAGAVNLGTNILHGMFNGIAGAISNAAKETKLSKL